jgi:peptidoglycan hydrolase-like amidase
MSYEYTNILINKIDIESFINIHEKIDKVQKILKNNLLINFDFHNINNNKINNINNNVQIRNVKFYLKKDNSSSIINNDSKCPICYNYISIKNFKNIPCNHVFCSNCLNEWVLTCIEKSLEITCPLCRKEFDNI